MHLLQTRAAQLLQVMRCQRSATSIKPQSCLLKIDAYHMLLTTLLHVLLVGSKSCSTICETKHDPANLLSENRGFAACLPLLADRLANGAVLRLVLCTSAKRSVPAEVQQVQKKLSQLLS